MTNTWEFPVTAYEGDEEVVFVIVNTSSKSYRGVHFEASSLTEAHAYETTIDANREEINTEVKENKVSLDIAPESVTTVVIKK